MRLILDHPKLAFFPWEAAALLWPCFMYAIFTEFTVNENELRFEDGMNGSWLISPIFYRFTFFRFLPRDFIPPFWINMGANGDLNAGRHHSIS